MREAASRFLPKHTAAAEWQHRSLSHVEQKGLSPMPKDRGAEQGDVDGPLECSLALGMVAAETRGRVAAQQVSFHGLELTTPQTYNVCRTNTQPRCRDLKFSAMWTRKTHRSRQPGTRCKKKKTAAWWTCGTWMMVTSCVTRSWCRLTCTISTSPTPELEQNETNRKRKSSVT